MSDLLRRSWHFELNPVSEAQCVFCASENRVSFRLGSPGMLYSVALKTALSKVCIHITEKLLFLVIQGVFVFPEDKLQHQKILSQLYCSALSIRNMLCLCQRSQIDSTFPKLYLFSCCFQKKVFHY